MTLRSRRKHRTRMVLTLLAALLPGALVLSSCGSGDVAKSVAAQFEKFAEAGWAALDHAAQPVAWSHGRTAMYVPAQQILQVIDEQGAALWVSEKLMMSDPAPFITYDDQHIYVQIAQPGFSLTALAWETGEEAWIFHQGEVERECSHGESYRLLPNQLGTMRLDEKLPVLMGAKDIKDPNCLPDPLSVNPGYLSVMAIDRHTGTLLWQPTRVDSKTRAMSVSLGLLPGTAIVETISPHTSFVRQVDVRTGQERLARLGQAPKTQRTFSSEIAQVGMNSFLVAGQESNYVVDVDWETGSEPQARAQQHPPCVAQPRRGVDGSMYCVSVVEGSYSVQSFAASAQTESGDLSVRVGPEVKEWPITATPGPTHPDSEFSSLSTGRSGLLPGVLHWSSNPYVPATAGGPAHIVLPTQDGLQALREDTGSPQWSRQLGTTDERLAPLSVIGGELPVVVGSELQLLDVATGETTFSADASDLDIRQTEGALAVTDGSTTYVLLGANHG